MIKLCDTDLRRVVSELSDSPGLIKWLLGSREHLRDELSKLINEGDIVRIRVAQGELTAIDAMLAKVPKEDL